VSEEEFAEPLEGISDENQEVTDIITEVQEGNETPKTEE